MNKKITIYKIIYSKDNNLHQDYFVSINKLLEQCKYLLGLGYDIQIQKGKMEVNFNV